MKRRDADDTYLFGKDMQHVYKWVIPIIGYVSCALSLMLLLPPIHSQADWGPHIGAAAIFIGIGMFLILMSKKTHEIANVQYALTEDTASNHGKITVSVSTQLPLYTCVLPLALSIKGGGISPLPVYLVSNTPITYIPNYSTGALGLAKKAMNLGIVVLPVNDRTTGWIREATNISPPEYPKIAYWQKKAN